MTQLPDHQDDDAPLDPTLERVQARLRRLMLIAGLTLGVGIFAVFGAILYRIVTLDTSAPPLAPGDSVPTLSRSDHGLSATARLVSVTAEGGRLYLAYDDEGRDVVLVVDTGTLNVVGRLGVTE